MPALPNVPGVLKQTFLHTIGNVPNCSYHIYWNLGGQMGTSAQYNQVCADSHTAWLAQMQGMTHISTVLTEIKIIDLSSPTAPVGAWVGNAPGSRTGTELPASTAMLYNLVVNRRYRGGKPRQYIPVGTNTDLKDAQTWLPAMITQFTTNYQAFRQAILSSLTTITANLQQCNVSYYAGHEWKQDQLGNYHRVSTLRTTPLIDVVVAGGPNARLGSQRGRLT